MYWVFRNGEGWKKSAWVPQRSFILLSLKNKEIIINDLPRQDQEARGAKKKAIKNAVWKQDKPRHKNATVTSGQDHPAPKKRTGASPAPTPSRNSSSTGKSNRTVASRKPSTLKRHRDMVESDTDDDLLEAPLMVEDVALPKDEDEQSADSDASLPRDKPSRDGLLTDSDGNESSATDGEDEDLAAMRLSDEVMSVVTNKQQVASKSRGTSKAELARDRKQAVETPTWANLDVECAVSESIEDPLTGGDSSEFQLSDNKGTAPTRKLTSDAKTRSIASLVKTESGKVKLLDQNLETRRVLQSAIVEVKCHLYFANGYPELVDKNQVTLQALIVVAEKRGAHSIKERLQSDEQYASQLGSLVDARVPILRRELKEDACAHADGYFRLGHTDTGKAAARRLLDKFAYIYALKFDINNEASPIGKKPYQGELLIFVIYWQLFHSSKSIAIKFAECFVEIANNKGQRPEVPIPLLALVATAVYAALLWKSQGSSSKFNFTGNLFSETYNYHVRFLEKLKKDAPAKFHCMMADIYEAAQKLRYSGAAAGGHAAELEAFELLDLDNMEED
ncbi:uncharacterized protein F5147DRAFT_781952 [Suillus discolor]|uniref:DUF6532 domain-containing protein n=1 Tax=Suillus discolor TaxID=1912936 RepID=A0A9P7JLN4_9AGAM|nr:uncharacterized protein F5147DRAFT_781952 [Suillus discolor]KAG2085580.1 hypothetical protein F5147DRAFT_781952 [Suillus discolor]